MHMCTSTQFLKYLYVWSSIRYVLNTGQHSLANPLIMEAKIQEVINILIIKDNFCTIQPFLVFEEM